MTTKLNAAADKHARELIKAGKVDKATDWAISADEENAILGDDNDWAAYSSWHLGQDDAEADDTKARYKYPIGKGGKVYRSALIAIRQRAGQQGADDIFAAAGELVDLIDDDGKDSDNDDAAALLHRARVAASPWALMPELLHAVIHPSVVRGSKTAHATAAAGITLRDRIRVTVIHDAPSSAQSRPASGMSNAPRAGAIAVIPVQGIITSRSAWYSDTGLDDFCDALAAALADDSIGAILLDIDSPGGSVYGVQEATSAIQSARAKKPVVAIANSLAASAAYWLGVAADSFYCTPSGEVGSIGVWQAHMDYSKMLAECGISTTLISAGKYKVEGNPYQPLDDDAQAFMQSRVDDYYASFTKAIAKGRNVPINSVRDGMGQGRVLGADAAQAEGMIDGVMSFNDVVGTMQKNMRAARNAPGASAANEISAARHRLNLI